MENEKKPDNVTMYAFFGLVLAILFSGLYYINKKSHESKSDAEYLSMYYDSTNTGQKDSSSYMSNFIGPITIPATLKPKINYITANISNAFITNQWTFDYYDDRYHLMNAERFTKWYVVNLAIASDIKAPLLPPLYAYSIDKNGQSKFIGNLNYRFSRWEDYGAYLGNYHSSMNDFKYSPTVYFTAGIQIENDVSSGNTIAIFIGNNNCVEPKKSYGNPEIYYDATTCEAPVLNKETIGRMFLVKKF